MTIENSTFSLYRSFPLPVYILGPNEQAECGNYSDLGGYEIAENIVYLVEKINLHPMWTLTSKLKLRVYVLGKKRML